MKLLLSLINCHSRLFYAGTQRDTWIPLIPSGVDYKFFLGLDNREPKSDEVFLDCDDTYDGLPSKVQEVARWALKNKYDYMLKCDDDVVLIPDKFLNSGFHNYDFVGHRNTDRGELAVPFGFCYVLSRKSMELVANAVLPKNNNDEAWVSGVLEGNGIHLHHDARYYLYRGKRSDFVDDGPRPLRAPPRPHMMQDEPVDGTFAWCMYIPWVGYRELPEEKNLKEFRRVFEEVCK